ncbi:Imm50 family immunity protein [Hymenobacter koreensis]|uniref:Uncharacterized protein n=1 Tax=Hymenobacter koreensis TaxID=1084523 RepID=A0ABP8IVL5_9BACT
MLTDEDYPAMNRVVNSEILHQHFGYWPVFHGAEIVKVIFETHVTGRYSVTFVIDPYKAWATRNVHQDATDCLIEIQFTGIQEMSFARFRAQNVIEELWFEEQGSLIKAHFDSYDEMPTELLAEEVIVLSLVPKSKRK